MVKKAGGVVIKDDDIYLVSKDGKLQFPKGHVEENESIIDCAKREVKEETGFKNLMLLDKKPIINQYQFTDDFGKKQNVKMYVYLFGLKSDKQSITCWMKIERLKGQWINLDKAVEQTPFNNVKEVLEQIKDRTNS